MAGLLWGIVTLLMVVWVVVRLVFGVNGVDELLERAARKIREERCPR